MTVSLALPPLLNDDHLPPPLQADKTLRYRDVAKFSRYRHRRRRDYTWSVRCLPRVKLMSARVKLMSARVKSMSPGVKSTSLRVKSTSPKVKSTSLRVKSTSPKVKSGVASAF
ncbi:uncharacterized protein SCHCODRAFT_01347011 [Schizophyllum commune H4-8]|nr:uncharacterized protein SCHCODRAFT_01347011 [Schizophyllum commune H4-8]KAI5899127.1 hypothetical protein SCHCODRAFT_01347011 [Schizophyllum commune H4-8]